MLSLFAALTGFATLVLTAPSTFAASAKAAADDEAFPGLVAAVKFVALHPTLAGHPVLAAAPAPGPASVDEGVWKFVAADGRILTATGIEEVRTVVRWLHPEDSEGVATGKIALVIGAKSLEATPGALALLPKVYRPFVLVEGRHYPVVASEQGAAFAVANSRFLIPIRSETGYGEALWQLRRTLAKRRVRMLAVGLTGAATVPVVAPRTKDGGLLVERVRGPAMREILRKLSGQTVLLTGEVRDDELVTTKVRSEGGFFRLVTLALWAKKAGTNLILLDTGDFRQPGETNLLYQTLDIAGLEKARDQLTLGPFLAEIGFSGDALRATLASGDKGRVMLTLSATDGLDGLIQGAGSTGTGDAIFGAFNDLVSQAGGTRSVRQAILQLESRAAFSERRSRVIPWLPSLVQYIYLGLFIIGALAFDTVTRWWQQLWPLRSLGEYRSSFEMVFSRIGRLLPLMFLFMPAVAIAALPVDAAQRIARLFATDDPCEPPSDPATLIAAND